MRVIAGALKSRAIRAPKGNATRPTSDRVRESLFSVIGDVHGVVVRDLYAGSGALAIEAISRGAARAVCVESSRAALASIAENVAALGLQERVKIVARKVEASAASLRPFARFSLVFADPPYADVAEGSVAEALASIVDPEASLLDEGALVVVEHAARDAPPKIEGLTPEETRRWGDTAATFYRAR